MTPLQAAINFDTSGTMTLIKDLMKAEAAAEELQDGERDAGVQPEHGGG